MSVCTTCAGYMSVCSACVVKCQSVCSVCAFYVHQFASLALYTFLFAALAPCIHVSLHRLRCKSGCKVQCQCRSRFRPLGVIMDIGMYVRICVHVSQPSFYSSSGRARSSEGLRAEVEVEHRAMSTKSDHENEETEFRGELAARGVPRLRPSERSSWCVLVRAFLNLMPLRGRG